MNNYVKQTDDVLVRMYEEGDFHAFDVLLARYQDKVFGYIMSIANDVDMANDAFQDTFVKAIMAIRNGQYSETGQFSSWLMRIARNQVLDRKRIIGKPNRWASSNEMVDGNGDVLDLFNNKDLCEPNAEMRMVVEQSYDDVRMLIDRLPAAQQEVVKLRFYEDMSFKEIAAATGVSINTSLGRMRYAMINLRRMASHRNLYATM